MFKFTILLSDLPVEINCRYEFTNEMCKKYKITDKEPLISVFVSDEDIKKEVALLDDLPEYYAEFLCIYRNIARELPGFGRAVFHGASITYKDKGLLFTAPSGTGKSTHIKLWRKYFGDDVKIVNGDKPILAAFDNGVTVYGTPWAGKERWQRNTSAPLNAICVIKRGTDNTVRKLSNDECITEFMHQIYLPDVPNALQVTLGILGKIIEKVPVYELSCDISENAVKSSFEALIGEKYGK